MKQKGLAPIAIVLIIATAVFGYLIYSGKIILPQEQTEQTQTAEVDETANWKTYTNTEYGYSIKYPNDFILDRASPVGDLTNGQLQELKQLSLLGSQKSDKPGSGVRLNIVFNPDNMKCTNNDECLQNMMNILKVSTKDVSYIYKNILGKNIKGFEYYYSPLKQLNQYFLFLYKNNILSIEMNITDLATDEITSVNQKTDQILSTFKFTP